MNRMQRTCVSLLGLMFCLGGCEHMESAVVATLSTLAQQRQQAAAPAAWTATAFAAPIGDWPPAGWRRKFLVGFTPVPKQPLSTESWLETWDQLLKQHSEVVLKHLEVDWQAFLAGPDAASFKELEGLAFVSGMAKRDDLHMFYVIDPLEHNREAIDQKLPPAIGRRFGDAAVRQAFTHYAMRIAKEYKPTYLGLASEINTYFTHHPDDAQAFVSLYKETYQAVKQLSPATQVTATLQYESLSGTIGGSPHWEYLDWFGDTLDVVAISTYPSPFFQNPDAIPADYYTRLARHTTKPAIVAESGGPTGGSAAFHGSEQNQERFLRRFVELTSDLDLRLWVWWFLHDWAGPGYPDFFKTMGLRTSQGHPKPSWETWKAMVARPVS